MLDDACVAFGYCRVDLGFEISERVGWSDVRIGFENPLEELRTGLVDVSKGRGDQGGKRTSLLFTHVSVLVGLVQCSLVEDDLG